MDNASTTSADDVLSNKVYMDTTYYMLQIITNMYREASSSSKHKYEYVNIQVMLNNQAFVEQSYFQMKKKKTYLKNGTY